eukprot:SM000133S26816  [mRNA]  locus=s133:275486:280643:- [translate_table: standard]
MARRLPLLGPQCAAPLVLLLGLLALAPGPALAGHSARGLFEAKEDLHKFFCDVDCDGDGEIEQHEASKFVEEAAGFEPEERDATLAELVGRHKVEDSFNYGGNTISADELADHLGNMLTEERVAEWVMHGLRLPQYVPAFRDNSIDGLDFPALVKDQGIAIERELGVQSPLHRSKIHGALIRQIFGIGQVPGMVYGLRWEAVPMVGVQLQWECPTSLGVPPLHKYVVQRRLRGGTSSWQQVGDVKDPAFLDQAGLVPSTNYSYRVQAWGGHGPSPWAQIDDVISPDQLLQPEQGGMSRPLSEYPLSGKPATDEAMSMVPNAVASQPGRGQGASETASRQGGASKDAKKQKSWKHSWWSWLWSVNGGLLVIAVLSRHSLFFTAVLGLWTKLKVRFLSKIKKKYYISQTSPYMLARCLARFIEVITFTVLIIHAKMPHLALLWQAHAALVQETGPPDAHMYSRWQRGPPLQACHDGEFMPSYTEAEHTWEEMMAAVNKNVMDKVSAWRGGIAEEDDHGMDAKSPGPEDVNFELTDGGHRDGVSFMPRRTAQTGTLSRRPTANGHMSGSSSSHTTSSDEYAMTRELRPAHSNGDLLHTGSQASLGSDSFSGSESQYERDSNDDNSGHRGPSLRDISQTVGSRSRRSRHRCNFEGCKLRFDRWHNISDWRAKLSKHYCRECQGVYCVTHTRYSPHGAHGQCGLDSKCVCVNCHARLPTEVRIQLERTNKLRVGPVVSREQSGGEGGSHTRGSWGLIGAAAGLLSLGHSSSNKSSSSGSGHKTLTPTNSGKKQGSQAGGGSMSIHASPGEEDRASNGQGIVVKPIGSQRPLAVAEDRPGPRLGAVSRRSSVEKMEDIHLDDTLLPDARGAAAMTNKVSGEQGAIDSSSGDIRQSKPQCQLRWRLCAMWALAHRGLDSLWSPNPSPSSSRSCSPSGQMRGRFVPNAQDQWETPKAAYVRSTAPVAAGRHLGSEPPARGEWRSNYFHPSLITTLAASSWTLFSSLRNSRKEDLSNVT